MTTEEIQKVKDFASRCIETLEKDNYECFNCMWEGTEEEVSSVMLTTQIYHRFLKRELVVQLVKIMKV
jgi:hypothetical protein